ncbi:MAG: hypothetical protein IJ529_01135 [Alphaproteobacteria bacterium]|nr:hypothetical protein [Alphaproteobacteria bacterium]MBQ9234897.1 hypothetical protein [Alphaproteobacteria bacterium]
MKLYSKEALILGGIYGILETLLSFLGCETTTGILFLLFILGMFMLCFNKAPKFLSNFISNYPKTSYYLCAIGWIPYFMFIVFVMLIGGGYIIDYSDTMVEYSTNIMSYPYTTIYLAIASLIIAFVRKKQISK